MAAIGPMRNKTSYAGNFSRPVISRFVTTVLIAARTTPKSVSVKPRTVK